MQRNGSPHLNKEVPELKGQIPTCENIARVIWNLLDPKITQGKLHRVRLYEKFRSLRRLLSRRRGSARMSKETLHIELGRRYRFFRVAPPAQFQIERQRKQPRSTASATIRLAMATTTPWKFGCPGKSIATREMIFQPRDPRQIRERKSDRAVRPSFVETKKLRNSATPCRQRKSFASKFLSA